MIGKLADFSLYVLTRSWFAFWTTTAFCGIYMWGNWHGGWHFDPYPFIFLSVFLTVFSYLQNIIIMTMQADSEKITKRLEAAERRRLVYMLHMMEAMNAHLELALEPYRKSAEADLRISHPDPKDLGLDPDTLDVLE